MSTYFKTSLLILTALVAENAVAQVADQQKAVLERAKTDSLTKANYQQVLQRLAIQLPVLPPLADDPNRPKNSIPRANGSGYTDVQGRSLTRSAWGAWVNYDEDKANDYTLPDPLVLKNGKPVTNANIWWQQRRPEIVNDYETQVFGRIPKNTPKVTFEVNNVEDTAFGGTAIKKTITGHIDNSAYPAAQPVIRIVLYLPAKARGRYP